MWYILANINEKIKLFMDEKVEPLGYWEKKYYKMLARIAHGLVGFFVFQRINMNYETYGYYFQYYLLIVLENVIIWFTLNESKQFDEDLKFFYSKCLLFAFIIFLYGILIEIILKTYSSRYDQIKIDQEQQKETYTIKDYVQYFNVFKK